MARVPATRGEPPAAGVGRATPTEPIGYEEFLGWCDEDTLAEWVDGRIVMMSPASWRHQQLVDFLVAILRIFVGTRKLGMVCSAPFQMKTGPGLPGREPDVLFVRSESLDRLRAAHLDGPADLVIEVVSPESRLRDRGEKLAEYEMGGVGEYWILDPDARRADFHVLSPDGRYQRVQADATGIYRSTVIAGFRVREEWLWSDPLPDELGVLRELGVGV